MHLLILQIHPSAIDDNVLSSSLPAVFSHSTDIAINVDNIDVSSCNNSCSVCACVCVRVRACACVTHTHTHAHTLCVYVHVCMRVCACVHACVCECVCM